MRCRARNVCADWRQEKCGSLKERSIHGTTASKHVERFITASPIAPLRLNNVQPCHPSIADPPSPPLRPRHMERTGSPHNLPSPCLTNAHPPSANWHCTAGGRGSDPACLIAYPPAATVKIRVLVTLSRVAATAPQRHARVAPRPKRTDSQKSSQHANSFVDLVNRFKLSAIDGTAL